jgi:hypothetical protein
VIVSHTRRMIFVANPKTGSSSVEAALAEFNEEPVLDQMAREGFFTRHHVPAYLLREIVGTKIWDAYFTFAFVRNPWDWFVSQHFYNARKRGLSVDQEKPFSADVVQATHDFLRVYRGAEWADSACQNAFVCDERGTILVDFLGRFEHLDRDFSLALSMAGGPGARLPHRNRSAHEHFTSYYTPTTVELVRRLYSQDVSLFGYDF